MVIVAKTTVIDEVNAFLKSLYLSRTGYPGHYKYRYYEPDGVSHSGNGGENKKMNTTVKHDGEYVLTSNGSKDFGEISNEFAKKIGRQAGKIHLRIGWHDESTDKGFGETHIERPKRMKQLNQLGFSNARDFVENVCSGYDTIYSSGMSLMLVKTKDLYTCIVELTPGKESDFYDVKTAFLSSRNNIKNKLSKEKIRLVWRNPTSLDLSKSLTP